MDDNNKHSSESEGSDDYDKQMLVDPSDNALSTKSYVLPKILDGTYYKVPSTVSYSYSTKATCLTCKREVAGSIKSTGNFHSHMDKKHPSLAESCRAYCQIKPRNSADMKILKIRRPLTKPTTESESKIKEIKIESSTRRPKIVDGKYYVLAKKWNNGKIAATCRLCEKNVCAHISNTGNLFHHMRVWHHEYIEECKIYCNNRSHDNKRNRKESDGYHEKPIEEVYIEDDSATGTATAISDGVFAEDFDSYFEHTRTSDEDAKHSDMMETSTGALRNETKNQKLPKCERQQFSQFVFASLNQLPDRNALKAMMDIQSVLTKYRLASLPDTEN